MTATEREAVRRWASTRDLPLNIADQLEEMVPWIFGAEGYSPDLATELMAGPMGAFGLSEDDVRSLGDWLSHFTDYDEPPLIPPQRMEALDHIRVAISSLPHAYLKVPWYAQDSLTLEVQLRDQLPVNRHVLEKVAAAMSGDTTITRVTLLYPDGSSAGTVRAK